MAISAAGTVFEIAATGSDSVAGSDTNGGGFNPGNANFPTDLTTDANTGNTASPVVSSVVYAFQASDAGHWVYIQSSGSWTLPTVLFQGNAVVASGLWAKIASVAGGKATLSAAVGAIICNATGGPFSLNTTLGISTQATPTAGKYGVDYSQGGTTAYRVTNAVTAGTTTVTSATIGFHKAMVGNLCYITGGTGAVVTGVWELVSNTNATTIIVNTATGLTAGTGTTLNVGGCLASPGMFGAFRVAGNHGYMKNATYTITSATINISGGCPTLANAPAITSASSLFGYNTMRLDAPKGSSRPTMVLNAAVSTATILTLGTASNAWYLIVDGAAQTTSIGVSSTNAKAFYVTAKNCTAGAFVQGSAVLTMCDATGCSTTACFGLGTVSAIYCVAWSNTIHGFSGTSGSPNWFGCLSVNNSGTTHGFITTVSTAVSSCTAYGNGGDGFRFTAATNVQMGFINSLSYGNTGLGFNATTAEDVSFLLNCAAGNNSVNFATNITNDSMIGCITLTADPFTNAAGANFSLNTTAGGGALCRAAGIAGALPGVSSTTGFGDIGAVQHADPASGGGGNILQSSIIQGLGAI